MSKSSAPSKETRDRVLDAAIAEFARVGFDAATVRDICRAADASLNAVNYHFGDKQSLYVEAVKTAHRRMREHRGIDLIDQIAEQFDGCPEKRLRAFIGGFVAMAMEKRDQTEAHHQLLFREMSNPTIATEEIAKEFVMPQFQQLIRIIEALLPADPAPDPIETRLLALSVVGECLHYRFAAPVIAQLLSNKQHRQLTVERVADHTYSVIMAAIERRTA